MSQTSKTFGPKFWELESVARPRAGRDLRRLVHESGFMDVRATAHYLSYGTREAIEAFGQARAGDCAEPWFASHSTKYGLLSEDELKRTEAAWHVWSESPNAFAAFAWCRATGRKPVAAQQAVAADGSLW